MCQAKECTGKNLFTPRSIKAINDDLTQDEIKYNIYICKYYYAYEAASRLNSNENNSY